MAVETVWILIVTAFSQDGEIPDTWKHSIYLTREECHEAKALRYRDGGFDPSRLSYSCEERRIQWVEE